MTAGTRQRGGRALVALLLLGAGLSAGTYAARRLSEEETRITVTWDTAHVPERGIRIRFAFGSLGRPSLEHAPELVPERHPWFVTSVGQETAAVRVRQLPPLGWMACLIERGGRVLVSNEVPAGVGEVGCNAGPGP